MALRQARWTFSKFLLSPSRTRPSSAREWRPLLSATDGKAWERAPAIRLRRNYASTEEIPVQMQAPLAQRLVFSRSMGFWRTGSGSSTGKEAAPGSLKDHSQDQFGVENAETSMVDSVAHTTQFVAAEDEISTLSGTEIFQADQSGEGSLAAGDYLQRVADESFGTTVWTVLKMPADGVVAFVDGVHTGTGAPWWLTIVGSTLAFRALIFPFTITYMKKSAQFASSVSLLPPIRPPPDSGLSYSEQYRVFTKRRLELGVPSPWWAVAGFVQVPLFFYWIIGLRGMAVSSYPGFETGGILWFTDLTVPVQGALGALFPTVVALTYFLNIQVAFRVIKPRAEVAAFIIKIYQWWLEAFTIPLFFMGFYLPQGVFFYWLTNNIFNLSQSFALQNDGFRVRVGLPLLSEIEKQRSKQRTESVKQETEMLDLDGLLLAAADCVANDREVEAMNLLKFASEKYPDEPDVYNVYGMLYIKKRQWSEALTYYNLVLSKSPDDPPRITALMGAGIALYNQEKGREAVDTMRPLIEMNVPTDPVVRVKYLRALVTLSSAMNQEGLKTEALSLLEHAAKWDSSINVYVTELREQLHSSK